MALGLTAATVGFIFILATTTTFDFTKAGMRLHRLPNPVLHAAGSSLCTCAGCSHAWQDL